MALEGVGLAVWFVQWPWTKALEGSPLAMVLEEIAERAGGNTPSEVRPSLYHKGQPLFILSSNREEPLAEANEQTTKHVNNHVVDRFD